MNTLETQLREKAEQMKVIIVCGRQHVIRPSERNGMHPPNYENTGKALVGVLKIDQTLDNFKNKWVNDKIFLASI